VDDLNTATVEAGVDHKRVRYAARDRDRVLDQKSMDGAVDKAAAAPEGRGLYELISGERQGRAPQPGTESHAGNPPGYRGLDMDNIDHLRSTEIAYLSGGA